MSRWSDAVTRARAAVGYAIGPGVRPPLHLVTVTPRPQLDGTLLYAAECSCRNWLCTDATTDAEARQRAKDACGVDVRFTDRPEQAMQVIRGDGSVIATRKVG